MEILGQVHGILVELPTLEKPMEHGTPAKGKDLIRCFLGGIELDPQERQGEVSFYRAPAIKAAPGSRRQPEPAKLGSTGSSLAMVAGTRANPEKNAGKAVEVEIYMAVSAP